MRDPGNLPQVQFERFVDEQFVEPAVFAKDEGIVEAGDEQDVLHLERHQVFEAFKALFRVAMTTAQRCGARSWGYPSPEGRERR